MRAAVIREFNAPLVIEETPRPTVEPGWVLVRVKACGLCGTDLKIVSGMLPWVSTPLIPGHEVAGEILEVGEGVNNVALGNRVTIRSSVTCGQCFPCQQGWDNLCLYTKDVGFDLNGGFAELVRVPAASVFPIPHKITFEEAAILGDAVATPYHALLRRAQVRAGETVAILGVGGLGVHAVQMAKAMGLRVVAVDVDQKHLEMAAELGATVVINSAKESLTEAIATQTSGRGVDVVLELSGNPRVARDGVSLLALRGKMVLIGYHPSQPFEVSSLTMGLKELEICGSRAATKQDMTEVIDWVGAGKIKPIIHEVMPLSRINQALEKLRSGQVIGRLVIQP